MKYNIKDADGNVIDIIKADAEFVEANFEHYELWSAPEPTAEEEARMWRDMELASTDYIVSLSDHPQRAAYLVYRESLRAWPSTEAFPETKPEL